MKYLIEDPAAGIPSSIARVLVEAVRHREVEDQNLRGLVNELDGMQTEICRENPRFKRVTVRVDGYPRRRLIIADTTCRLVGIEYNETGTTIESRIN